MSGEPDADIAEVTLRIGARAMEKAPVERFLKEIIPIALNGPPSVTGLNAGRSKVDEIIAYWPALIPKTAVAPNVEVVRGVIGNQTIPLMNADDTDYQ